MVPFLPVAILGIGYGELVVIIVSVALYRLYRKGTIAIPENQWAVASPGPTPFRQVVAITDAAGAFDTRSFPEPSQPPTLAGTGWSAGRDQKALSDYVGHLNEIRTRVQRHAERGFKKFDADYAKVEEQRRVVVENILRARDMAKRFAEISAQAQAATIDRSRYHLELPSKPVLKTAKLFAQELIPDSRPLGKSVSRMAMNKSVSPGALIAHLVIGGLILGVRQRKNILEGKLQVEKWYGLITQFAGDLRQTTEILGRAHAELVLFSTHLAEANDEIGHITAAVAAMPPDATSLSALNATNREALQKLAWWNIAVSQIAARSV